MASVHTLTSNILALSVAGAAGCTFAPSVFSDGRASPPPPPIEVASDDQISVHQITTDNPIAELKWSRLDGQYRLGAVDNVREVVAFFQRTDDGSWSWASDLGPASISGPNRDLISIQLEGAQAMAWIVDDRAISVSTATDDLMYPGGTRTMRALTSHDLDGDGSDELVIAEGGAAKIVNNLEQAMATGTPRLTLEQHSLNPSFETSALAVVHDTVTAGVAVVAAHANKEMVRLYFDPSNPQRAQEDHLDIELPPLDVESPAIRVLGSHCSDAIGLVQRANGAVLSIAHDGVIADLAHLHDAAELSVHGGSLAVMREGSTQIEIYQGCSADPTRIETDYQPGTVALAWTGDEYLIATTKGGDSTIVIHSIQP